MDADGNAVVAWTSNGQDGSQHGVYFQRYNSGGSTVGAETRANDNTAGVQANVSVAMDADGDFLVTWQSATGESPAGGGYGIFGQFYSFVTAAAPESASKILAEFQVNNQTEGNQLTPAAAMIDPGEYVVVYDNLSGFGGTRLGPTSLPVELTRFDAEMTDNAALLTWLTATETDNAGFELQQATRRADAEPAWKPLVWIDGVGTTTEAQAYTYRVEDLAPGRHMFRLKQVDFDGEFEYSPIVEVEVEVPGTHVLSAAYPNPFNPSTQFELVLAREQHVQIAVFDLQGRQVRMLQSGVLSENTQHVIRFDADQLPGGLYVIRVVGEGFVETRSVTLVK
jgi:hypothetical protein